MYCDGITQDQDRGFSPQLNIPLGVLPFKYLGMPLSAKKRTYIQCKPLLERITGKLQGWTNKLLSHGGKMKLVQAVIQGMLAFWAQVFILPKKLIKQVDTLCRAFIWSGELGSMKSPIS